MRIFEAPLAFLSRPKRRLSQTHRRLLKACLHLLIGGYVAIIFYLAATDQIAGDPVETLLEFSGINALNLLLITLCISPLARWLKYGELMNYRRLLGLYAFFYALLHVFTFVAFELLFNMTLLFQEIINRPYITIGMAALIILLCLAATSPMAMRKYMGKRWQHLHNLVYAATALALMHFSWSQKTLLQEPLWYWFIFIILMAPRGYRRFKKM